ncbi:MAG: ATP-dependent Clp protease ATP-binding subunit, partial [Proteobacteria bacterium]|nr:ATP-dependent Clp protease ATP-binding subunit [Pseudomonadota bacterium]
MDDGRLTDAKGRTVDFRNTVIIMTSNVGAQHIKREASLGFRQSQTASSEEDYYKTMRTKVLSELKKVFRPEFLNRVDATVVFRALTREDVGEIVDLELNRVRLQLSEHELELEITDDAKQFLAEQGYDPDFGARPLRRVIQNLIEDPLAEELLRGSLEAGGKVVVERDGDELRIDSKAPVQA